MALLNKGNTSDYLVQRRVTTSKRALALDPGTSRRWLWVLCRYVEGFALRKADDSGCAIGGGRGRPREACPWRPNMPRPTCSWDWCNPDNRRGPRA